jgi:hypothetical protein
MNWIEFKKRKGQPVSAKIEKPNKRIAKALHSLSEMSFVTPYTESRPKNASDIEYILQNKLTEINGFQANKEHH